MMQKIIPCLWFDDNAEEAMHFYTSIFKNSMRTNIAYYGDENPELKSKVLLITFQLDGQEFMAINGGPVFSFTPAISLFVNCEIQGEVDNLWERLSEGGEKGQCGWLKDKFGVSWQIVPTALGEMMQDPDPAKTNRLRKALLQMKKLDIEKLRQAYEQD
jgi:predicted 3-demethylubiquinone-9 3-methyltransferase (glyoxalase superfamily)